MSDVLEAFDLWCRFDQTRNGAAGLGILLPWGSAIHTLRLAVRMLLPLLHADLVKVLATCSLAPQNFFVILEWHATDWTITLDRFTLAVVDCFIFDLVVRDEGELCCGGIGKDLLELGGKISNLIDQVTLDLENEHLDIYDVFAALLVSHFGVDASAGWTPPENYVVNITGTSRNLKGLLRNTISVEAFLAI